MNRFSKDIDTIDNTLAGTRLLWKAFRSFRLTLVIADSFRTLLFTTAGVVGTIVLISVLLPWFLIAVAIVLVFYTMAFVFYRASAREMKVRSFQAHAVIIFKGICSDWTPSCDRLYIHISLRRCRELPPFVPMGKRTVSIRKIGTW